MDKLMTTLIDTVAAGAERMMDLFYEPNGDIMEQKPDLTPYSRKKDRGNGELMVGIIKNCLPGTIICEDYPTVIANGSNRVIRVDPWDGSSFSFSHVALPCVGVTVSEGDEDVAAAVAMPFGEGPDDKVIIFAEKGGGAWQFPLYSYWETKPYEPKRITVKGREKEQSVAGHIVLENPQTIGPRQQFVREALPFVTYWESARSSIGTAMLVAQGRYVMALEDCVGGHHDIGPGSVIVREAGGEVFTPDWEIPVADKYHCCLMTNGRNSQELKNALAMAYREYQGFRPPKKQ